MTRQDRILSRVHQYTREGWPSSTPDELKPYRERQLELTTQGDTVLWGNRVIIPLKLRSRITEELHRDNPGITRMKALARSYFWWPGLDHNLERCVQECLACQAVRNAPAPPPLHPCMALANQAMGENPYRLCWPISRMNVPGRSGRRFQVAGSHTDEYDHFNQHNRGITSSAFAAYGLP